MTLTPSEVEALSKSLAHWEIAEYIFAALVTIACAGEYTAEFTNWLTGGMADRKDRLRKRSTLLLIFALSLELVCLVKTNSLSGRLIGSLSEKATEADAKAQSAINKASVAQDKANQAESASQAATEKSAEAGASACNALAVAGAARKETARLNGELRSARAQLEAVEAKRAELEKSLVNLAVCNAPRVIPSWTMTSPGITKTAVDPLRIFAGRQAIIEFLPDPETRRAALNVVASLDGAGWKIIRVTPVDRIEDGVEVQPYFKTPASTSAEDNFREWDIHVRASEAADALVDFLHSYNWQARLGWPGPENDIPPDGLKVRIGLYPAVTFVSPPGAKEFAAAVAQSKQETENWRKQAQNEHLKRDEEILKHLSPEQAVQFRAIREQRNKEERLWMERYSGPCQPLTPLSPSVP